ncbi:related to ferric-chelate reductase [Rhynchosporium secalis]|uniref:Related to ferric-chelate reductase n=1 Tax=Rhynchosporium secalis TaxID=38038 RepID=A0A1E1MUK8_RHYSE|nr:related to ferric-chelate reductase [Rhynchosporium secalis]
MAYTSPAFKRDGNPVSAGNKNATALAAAAMHAAALKRKHQHTLNKEAAEYYAVVIAAVIALFTIFHWARLLYSRYASKSVKQYGVMKAQVAVTRKVRHVLVQRIPGFTSIGHAFLVTIFILLNILSLFIDMDFTSILPFAKRLGWMAISNISFVTFLALKNTPLAFLTASSYEKLNCLHQIAGYTTVILALLHGICISSGFIKVKLVSILHEHEQIFGITAGVALFIMMTFALVARRLRYEVFYASHVAMFITLIVTIGFHQPRLAQKGVFSIIFAGSIWAADRILRGMRILWYSYDNRATITPLPQGGTRIVLRRSLSRATPGTHCFLWLPQIRLLETHPFTIVNNSQASLELVISAYDGFTKDLHNYALKNSDAILRASIDGPYGTVPNFSKTADRVILVAGGSGASFTFGIALDMIEKLGQKPGPTIEFIWTVREQETLTWFSKELALLRASPRVNIILHSTRLSPVTPATSPIWDVKTNSSDPSPISPDSPIDVEKQPPSLSYIKTSALTNTIRQADPVPKDVEKKPIISNSTSSTPQGATKSVIPVAVLPGRPDIDGIIRHLVAKSGDEERIVIAACGPDELMRSVRRTATNSIKAKGPSIELHCEQFGW